MNGFFSTRSDIDPSEYQRLSGWAQGSPGRAVSLDVEAYVRRREAVLILIGVAVRENKFIDLLPATESLSRRGSEPLSAIVDSLYGLLQDITHCKLGRDVVINADEIDRISQLARKVSFRWIEKAMFEVDEIRRLERRNVQKQIALESLTLSLRS